MDMSERNALLRKIPSVERVLQDLQENGKYPRAFLLQEVRAYLHELRDKIATQGDTIPIEEAVLFYPDVLRLIEERLRIHYLPGLTRALNATGVILHTGLGRAVLPPQAIAMINENLRGYVVLEVDRETGERSQRDLAIRKILCMLTGAEDATVVNNNAGAVLLVLASLARNKEVIVSCGQLVEIGGSFRIPEVMRESGAQLVGVGCTNRTYISDYAKAISSNTAALLHVHTSNFRVVGFTQEVALPELSVLAHEKKVYLIQDAGSGAIRDLFSQGLSQEPLISESIASGVDIVTFSGDKLLGSCQAGIIVGKKVLIEKIRNHPLARALRVDKVTLAILETTLKSYLDDTHVVEDIPTVRMFCASVEEIKKRAEAIAEELRKYIGNCKIYAVPSVARAGSGAFPIEEIPSYAVTIQSDTLNITALAKSLRLNQPPIFGRVQNDTLFLDPRTLLPAEDEELIANVVKICQATSTSGN